MILNETTPPKEQNTELLESSSRVKMRTKEIMNKHDIIEKLVSYLKYLSGIKSNHLDLFNNRNLLTLIDYRDSKDPLVRRLSIFVLSQFLLAKENILEIVKEKSFFKFRHQIFLNNFDSFDHNDQRLVLESIIDGEVPSKMSEKVILLYYAEFRYDEDKKKLSFMPGMISLGKMKQIATDEKLWMLPDPKNTLVWINYTKKKDKELNPKKKKKYKKVNLKRLTSSVEKGKRQNFSMKRLFTALLKIKNVQNKRKKKKAIRDKFGLPADYEAINVIGVKTINNASISSGLSFLLPKIREKSNQTNKGEEKRETISKFAHPLKPKKTMLQSKLNQRKRDKERMQLRYKIKRMRRKKEGFVSSYNLFSGEDESNKRKKKHRSFSIGVKKKNESFIKAVPNPYNFDKRLTREDVIDNCKNLFFKLKRKKRKG